MMLYINDLQFSILLPSFYMENETTEGHKGINKGGSHDSNSDLAYFGARALLSSFSKWKMEHREHGLPQPSLPIQVCAHMVTCIVQQGYNLHRVNMVRGNWAPRKCLRTLSSLSDQVIKRMFRCPWSPQMEPNLTGLQSLRGIQYNIPSLFTTNHNLI